MNACPSCGAAIGARQRWCLTCGSAALRRVATARRWGGAALVASVVAGLALAGIGYAVVTVASS